MNQRYALLSVFDKTGIVELAHILKNLHYSIISTGGTAKTLQDAGVDVTPIQEITGNPESFDGRIKTISFQIESGILFDRKNPKHVKEAEDHKIKPIDLVVCNLYPFEQTISKKDVQLNNAVENIDVGGPTMIRSAAKNFQNVLVVVNPQDYKTVEDALESETISEKFRQELAAKAFAHLSFYDAQIAKYLCTTQFPEEATLPGRKTLDLRYGENPHQEKSSVYIEPGTNSPLAHLKHLVGRALSYVNFTDIAAGLEAIRIFDEPAAVVVKHNSPCGIALGKTIDEALDRAIEADPVSAFGGAIILNKPLDAKTAAEIASFKEESRGLIDIVAAPEVANNAIELLKSVRKTTGIYAFGDIPEKRSNGTHVRFFDGGFVLQQWDDEIDAGFAHWKVVTKVQPSEKQMRMMKLAWKFVTRIRSNAVIVVDKEIPMTRGIGTGQTSRVGSCEIALKQAGDYAKGAILASDSFFPFKDCVELAGKRGIGAIIQQGGSLKDQESIDEADRLGIPMIFTGRRAFSH